MNDIMEWLSNYAYDNDIGYIMTHYLEPDTPSTSDCDDRLVVVNMEWKNANEVPFSFAHEIGHIMCGDKGKRYFKSENIKDKSEYRANLFAIKLLFKFCSAYGLNFTNPITFCEQFGVPTALEYVVATEMQ